MSFVRTFDTLKIDPRDDDDVDGTSTRAVRRDGGRDDGGASDDDDERDARDARDDDASVLRERTRGGGVDARRAARCLDGDGGDGDGRDGDGDATRDDDGDAREIIVASAGGWKVAGWNHETKRRFRTVVSRLRARV